MRILTLLILLASLSPSDAFEFGRRGRRNICPGGVCGPHPTLNPNVPAEAAIDAIIPEENRIVNSFGNCTWSAAEDVFVAAGYPQFRGIKERAVKEGWRGASISNVIAAAKDANIPIMEVHDRSLDIFDYAKEEGVGVFVEIPGHSLVCVGLDADHAYMLDNNQDQQGKLAIRKWPRAEFLKLWEGHACCPRKKKPKDKPPATTPAKPTPAITTTPAVTVGPVAPAVDPNAGKLDELGQAMAKLTDATTNLAGTLSAQSTQLGTIETRLAAAEKARCSCAGASTPAVPPPSASKDYGPELDQVKAELAALKDSLSPIRLRIGPKP